MIVVARGREEEREGRFFLVRNVDSFSMEERRDPRDPVLLRRIGKPITLLSKYTVCNPIASRVLTFARFNH